MADDRWGQLTYTSFDSGTGSAGGWGIKDTTGSMTEAEIQAIQSRIVTTFDTAEEIPQFPSSDDIARLPRKLTYVPLEESTSYGYWHSVPCGLDGVGRPGNVFSHVVVDRRIADGTPSLRPITLWRSLDWQTPFGQPEILATSIGDGILSAGSVVTAESIIDFLLDAAVFRGPTLAVLLDALSAAHRGGRRVIIATDSPDTAAMWIGATAYLMAPRTSREVPFSVFDRPASVTGILRRGALIAGVAYVDIEASSKIDNVVVIDDRAMHSLGDLGGEPHKVGETAIPVTAWSVMAEVALQEPSLARAVLERIDHVSSQFASTSLSLAWPLAMTVALMPDDLLDASTEAAAVLRDASPATLPNFPELWAAAAFAAQGLFGSSIQQALDQVVATSAEAGSVMHDLAVAVYQERVLRDPSWLYGEVPAEAPRASTRGTDSLAQQAAAALAALPSGNGPSDAVQVLRLGDWIIKSGLTGGYDASIQVALETLIQEHVVPVLLDPLGGPELVARVGTMAEDFVGEWVRSLINESLTLVGSPGARLPPSVIRWLFPAPAQFDRSDLDLEYVVEGIVSGLANFRSFRARAWTALADRDVQVATDPRMHQYFAKSDGEWVWSAADVCYVEARHPGALPDSVVLASLAAEPSGPGLDLLLVELERNAPSRSGGSVAELARARTLADQLARGGILPASEADRCLRALDGLDVNPSWASLLVLVASYVLGVSSRSGLEVAFSSSRAPLLRSSVAAAGRISFETTIQRHADEGRFGRDQFSHSLNSVLLYSPECPVRAEDGAPALMGRLSWPGETDAEGRLVVFLAYAMVLARVADVDMELDYVQGQLISQIPDGRTGDKLASDFERFVKTWRKYFRSRNSSQAPSRPSLRGMFGNSSSQKETT